MVNKRRTLKNVKQNNKRRLRNMSVKSQIKTVTKKVEQAAAGGQDAEAREALARAIPVIDKAASKGVIHRNNASRKVSRLTRIVERTTTSPETA